MTSRIQDSRSNAISQAVDRPEPCSCSSKETPCQGHSRVTRRKSILGCCFTPLAARPTQTRQHGNPWSLACSSSSSRRKAQMYCSKHAHSFMRRSRVRYRGCCLSMAPHAIGLSARSPSPRLALTCTRVQASRSIGTFPSQEPD
jgi:hypothetical protein